MGDEIFGAGFYRQFELALQRALHVGKLHVEVLQSTENVATGELQRLGCFREIELFTHVLEQRLANQLFQLTNLQAHRRLGQRHFLGCPAVRAQITDLIEDP